MRPGRGSAAGRVVASGTPADQVRSHQPDQRVRFTAPVGLDTGFLRRVAGVESVERPGGRAVVVTGSGPLLARVGHALVSAGIEPADLAADSPSLEDAYLALTSRPGREAGET